MENRQSKHDCVKKVQISGVVVQKTHSFSVTTLIIATVDPLSGKVNYPHVVALDENVKEGISREINIKDRILIEASLCTSKRFPKGSIVIRSYKKLLSRIDAEFSGKEYIPDINKVLIQGEVAKPPYMNDKCTVLSVKIVDADDGYVYYPQIVCFDGKAVVASKKKVGDIVQILCGVHTQNTRNGSKKLSRQSVIAKTLQ